MKSKQVENFKGNENGTGGGGYGFGLWMEFVD